MIVSIDYINHKGKRAVRFIRPIRIWFGNTEFHPNDQWMMEADDVERNVRRDFAISGIILWNGTEYKK
jgi:predicted DNA-binding transcriptional regulator YafY